MRSADEYAAARAGLAEIGFGIETAVLLLTPVALDVAKRVALFLASQFGDAVKKESGEAVGRAWFG